MGLCTPGLAMGTCVTRLFYWPDQQVQNLIDLSESGKKELSYVKQLEQTITKSCHHFSSAHQTTLKSLSQDKDTVA